EDGIRDRNVTGVQTCALPISAPIIGHGAADQTPVTLALSAMVGRQLPVFSIIIPAFLIVVLAGWRRMLEVLPAVLAAGVVFAIRSEERRVGKECRSRWEAYQQ